MWRFEKVIGFYQFVNLNLLHKINWIIYVVLAIYFYGVYFKIYNVLFILIIFTKLFMLMWLSSSQFRYTNHLFNPHHISLKPHDILLIPHRILLIFHRFILIPPHISLMPTRFLLIPHRFLLIPNRILLMPHPNASFCYLFSHLFSPIPLICSSEPTKDLRLKNGCIPVTSRLE